MAVTLRQESLYLRDENTGTYKNPAILFSDIGETEAEVKANIRQEGSTQISAINARAVAVESSLPTSGEMEAMVAESFVSGAYSAGDYVVYNDHGVNKLYRFTSDHTGAWTGTDVVQVAVGSEMTDLKSAMNDNGLAQLIIDGWIIGHRWFIPAVGSGETGHEGDISSWRYIKIPCTAGDKFVITASATSGYRPWGFFDSSDYCLKREENHVSITNQLIEAPAETSYLVINQDANGGRCYIGEFLVSNVEALIESKADAVATAQAISAAKADCMAQSVAYDYPNNLYDKTTGGTSGYWNCTGYHTTSGNLRITHPIPVKNGVTYTMPHDASGLGSNNWIAKVDYSGAFISAISGAITDGKLTFTADFNGYVSANIGAFTDDNYYFSVLYSRETNPLFGKKLSVNGDSICAGAGYAGGYAKMIGLRNNMTVQNIAENGATIVTGTQFAGGTDRHWISTSIVDMDSDSDYVIIEGGVNDDASVIGENKLGSLTAAGHFGTESGGEFINDFDPTTFCGALEYTFFEVYKRFPGKKVGFIIVHKCATLLNSNGVSGSNRYPLIVNACKKWGIPYCDLNTECPPLNYIPALKSAYTNDGDGWHPNEAGYAKYYVPKIEEWMKTL